jgi:death-on-curing protein
VSQVRLPPPEALIDLQRDLIEQHGGAHGLRDRALLEQCLARLRQVEACGTSPGDAVALAAALCTSLCRNHAFVDGNKRIAFLGLGVTLALNGHYLDAREGEATEVMFRLAAGEIAEAAFEAWVRARVVAA